MELKIPTLRILLSVSFAITSPVSAQDSFPMMDWSNVGWSAVSDSIGREIVGSDEAKRDAKLSSESKEVVHSPLLIYIVSKSRTRSNLAKFVAKTRLSDPDSANKMEQLFASNDIISQIDAAMRGIGLRADNSSHAYAVWWVSAWKASRGDTSTADAGTYALVAAQAARALGSAPEFKGSGDSQKQEMAEAMLVQSALIDAAVEAYADDEAMMAKLVSSIKQGAKASGIDLDSMTLTQNGFVPSQIP